MWCTIADGELQNLFGGALIMDLNNAGISTGGPRFHGCSAITFCSSYLDSTLLRTFNVPRIDTRCVSEYAKVQKRRPSLLAGGIESAIRRQVNLTRVRKLRDIESKPVPARHSRIGIQIREVPDSLMLMHGYQVHRPQLSIDWVQPFETVY
jgi:hypothetical protein